MTSELIKVAVDAPLAEALTYLNLNMESPPQRGESVLVTLGKRKATGVVLGASEPNPEFKMKPIQAKNDRRKAIPENYLKWLEWISSELGAIRSRKVVIPVWKACSTSACSRARLWCP